MSAAKPESGTAERRYDPAAVARVLATTGEKLIELLTEETGLLRASKTAEIAALAAEKNRLSQVFSAGWRHFQTAPGELEAMEPQVRGELTAVAMRLERAAAENAEVLRVGQRAAELVLAAVSRALEAQRPRPTYTAGRTVPAPAQQRAGLGFNRSA